MIVQLVEVRTLEIREVTFRASPLSTSKETHTHKKKKSGHVQHTKQPYYVHYTQ